MRSPTSGWGSWWPQPPRRSGRASCRPDPDPEQLIYEVDALLLMAHAAYIMYGDPALLERARVGLVRLLGPRPA